MANTLVVGLIEGIGKRIYEIERINESHSNT